MICPKCAHEKTGVIGTVTSVQTERFRKCKECGYTFCTVEAIKHDRYWREYAKETFDEDTQGKKYEEQNS